MANNITPMTINGVDADVYNDFSWQGDKYAYKTGVTTETINEYGNVEIEEEVYTFVSKDHGHANMYDFVLDEPMPDGPVHSPWTGERIIWIMRNLEHILWSCDPIDHGHTEYLKTLQVNNKTQFGEISLLSTNTGIEISTHIPSNTITLTSSRAVPNNMDITGVKNQNNSNASGVHIAASGTDMAVNGSELLLFVEETKHIDV